MKNFKIKPILLCRDSEVQKMYDDILFLDSSLEPSIHAAFDKLTEDQKVTFYNHLAICSRLSSTFLQAVQDGVQMQKGDSVTVESNVQILKFELQKKELFYSVAGQQILKLHFLNVTNF